MTWCRKFKRHLEKFGKLYLGGIVGAGVVTLIYTSKCNLGCDRKYSTLEKAKQMMEQNYKEDSILKEIVFNSFIKRNELMEENIEEWIRKYGGGNGNNGKKEEDEEEVKIQKPKIRYSEDSISYEPDSSLKWTPY